LVIVLRNRNVLIIMIRFYDCDYDLHCACDRDWVTFFLKKHNMTRQILIIFFI